jgi:hypothetical protein
LGVLCKSIGVRKTVKDNTSLFSPSTFVLYRPYSLSTGLKWPGHEADSSFLSNAEVENAWGYTSTPPYILMLNNLLAYLRNKKNESHRILTARANIYTTFVV